jgi:receptor protein-tyrosine kinase
MRSTFDIVIIDTPCLSEGDDGAIIAIRSGAALAVAQARRTKVADFNDLLEGLSNAGVAVVGSVLNEVTDTKTAVK